MSLIQNLIRNYDDFEIYVPRWEISDVGITALKGPSGAGKTSIIRLMLGLDDCGCLSWDFKGQDLAKLPIGERRLGVVFQNYELFGHLSARENIEFAMRARNINIQANQNKFTNIVEKLKIVHCLERKAKVISGGEKQRVALARALIGEPCFLFLDEPFASLDSNARHEARELVKHVISEYKIPTLLVSHDNDDIRDLAQQVVEINNGRIL